MTTKDKSGPDDRYGPKLATLMKKLADEISRESGASKVYLTASFVLDRGSGARGKMRLDIKVSPDAKKERLSGSLEDRGAELKRKVEESLRRHAEGLGE